jgi:thiamine biosynthesis lipoprotein
LYAKSESDGRTAARAAFQRAEDIERAVSSWRPQSEANELTHKIDDSIKLSDELCTMLAMSLDWAKRSDGAFDPTLYHSIRVWSQARQMRLLPTEAAIQSAHVQSGWQGVRLNHESCLATVTTPGLRFDFGGIAKGFAADEMIMVLDELGITQALVELGGDVVASGPPPNREGWSVRIETEEGTAQEAIIFAHGAIATSGDAAQFHEVDGVRYSHIIDPKTGRALARSVQVTVIVRGGKSPGADADAIASAASVIMARGEEPSELLRQRPGVSLR